MGNALRATWHTSRGRVAAIQHVRRAASKAHDVAKAAKLRQSICAGIALAWRDGAEIQAAARRLASWSKGRRGQWQHFPRSLSSLGVISAARLASARGPTFLRMDNAPLQGSSPGSAEDSPDHRRQKNFSKTWSFWAESLKAPLTSLASIRVGGLAAPVCGHSAHVTAGQSRARALSARPCATLCARGLHF